MGRGKRKAEHTKYGEQPKDPEHNTVTDTDYHTSDTHAWTFRQIYEDYMTNTKPEREEEAETWRKVNRSCMHLVAAWPALLPYHDMTRWVLSRCRAKGIISKADGSNLVSYVAENVASIYGLPRPECVADEAYVKAFSVKHPEYDNWLKEWWHDSDSFKPTSLHTYRIQDFHEDYRPTAIMLYRLMGERNCNTFRKDWVPFMHVVVEEGKI